MRIGLRRPAEARRPPRACHLSLHPGDGAGRPSLKKAIWGPVMVDGKSQFPIYRDLGVGICQKTLNWNEVAPTRPAHPRDPADAEYQWPAELDLAISEGRKYGIRVLVQVLYSPRWANGGRAKEWAPRRATTRTSSRQRPGATARSGIGWCRGSRAVRRTSCPCLATAAPGLASTAASSTPPTALWRACGAATS